MPESSGSPSLSTEGFDFNSNRSEPDPVSITGQRVHNSFLSVKTISTEGTSFKALKDWNSSHAGECSNAAVP